MSNESETAAGFVFSAFDWKVELERVAAMSGPTQVGDSPRRCSELIDALIRRHDDAAVAKCLFESVLEGWFDAWTPTQPLSPSRSEALVDLAIAYSPPGAERKLIQFAVVSEAAFKLQAPEISPYKVGLVQRSLEYLRDRFPILLSQQTVTAAYLGMLDRLLDSPVDGFRAHAYARIERLLPATKQRQAMLDRTKGRRIPERLLAQQRAFDPPVMEIDKAVTIPSMPAVGKINPLGLSGLEDFDDPTGQLQRAMKELGARMPSQ